jgi:hypothetical protein
MRPATATHGPRDGSSLSARMRAILEALSELDGGPRKRKAKAPLLHVSGTGGLRRIPWKIFVYPVT